MSISGFPACLMCIMCMPGTLGGQKSLSGTLEPEILVVLSQHNWVLRPVPGFSARITSTLNHGAILPAPQFYACSNTWVCVHMRAGAVCRGQR